MKKRILMIGNTSGLSGVIRDIDGYKDFFMSPCGGLWYDDEITILSNPHKSELLQKINSFKNERLDYLITIFQDMVLIEEMVQFLNSTSKRKSSTRRICEQTPHGSCSFLIAVVIPLPRWYLTHLPQNWHFLCRVTHSEQSMNAEFLRQSHSRLFVCLFDW